MPPGGHGRTRRLPSSPIGRRQAAGRSTVVDFPPARPPLLAVPRSPGFGRRGPDAPGLRTSEGRHLGTPSNSRLCHQVARTITNLQQQIQQHQRQLAQALLVKPPPPPPHLSLHPSAGKSAMDSFPAHPQAPGLPDLQTKEPQSSPGTFAPYPLGESPAWPLGAGSRARSVGERRWLCRRARSRRGHGYL